MYLFKNKLKISVGFLASSKIVFMDLLTTSVKEILEATLHESRLPRGCSASAPMAPLT